MTALCHQARVSRPLSCDTVPPQRAPATNTPLPLSPTHAAYSVLPIGDRGEKRERLLARVEPGVLDDDGHVGLEQGGIIRVARDRRGVLEVVEAHMQRAPRRHRHLVRPYRVAVGT